MRLPRVSARKVGSRGCAVKFVQTWSGSSPKGKYAVTKQRVVEALRAQNDLELPDTLVREEAARAIEHRRHELIRSGIDPETVELQPDAFEGQVKRRLSLELLFSEIVKVHEIELDHSSVRARVTSIASTYREPAKVVDWYYSDRERLSAIEASVLEDQVVEWILERVRIVEESSSFDQILNPGQTSRNEEATVPQRDSDESH